MSEDAPEVGASSDAKVVFSLLDTLVHNQCRRSHVTALHDSILAEQEEKLNAINQVMCEIDQDTHRVCCGIDYGSPEARKALRNQSAKLHTEYETISAKERAVGIRRLAADTATASALRRLRELTRGNRGDQTGSQDAKLDAKCFLELGQSANSLAAATIEGLGRLWILTPKPVFFYGSRLLGLEPCPDVSESTWQCVSEAILNGHEDEHLPTHLRKVLRGPEHEIMEYSLRKMREAEQHDSDAIEELMLMMTAPNLPPLVLRSSNRRVLDAVERTHLHNARLSLSPDETYSWLRLLAHDKAQDLLKDSDSDSLRLKAAIDECLKDARGKDTLLEADAELVECIKETDGHLCPPAIQTLLLCAYSALKDVVLEEEVLFPSAGMAAHHWVTLKDCTRKIHLLAGMGNGFAQDLLLERLLHYKAWTIRCQTLLYVTATIHDSFSSDAVFERYSKSLILALLADMVQENESEEWRIISSHVLPELLEAFNGLSVSRKERFISVGERVSIANEAAWGHLLSALQSAQPAARGTRRSAPRGSQNPALMTMGQGTAGKRAISQSNAQSQSVKRES